MSMDDGITTAPVPPIIRRRDEEDMQTHLLPARHHRSCGFLCKIANCLRHDLYDEENPGYCLRSCLYYFFCHAVDSVLLHVCCCRCLRSLLAIPDEMEPRNHTQKFFAACVRQLSNLWATALLLFVARWVFLRPFDVKPMLGASTVTEFELQWPAATTAGSGSPTLYLHFNLATHLLFKNSHQYYAVGYDHPAVAIYYAGEKLGPVDDEIPPFRQEPLMARVLDQFLVGRLHNASTAVVNTFARDKVKGHFDMVMRIRVTLSYKYWPFKEEYFTFYDCPLSSPVPQTGLPAVSSPAYCNTVKI